MKQIAERIQPHLKNWTQIQEKGTFNSIKCEGCFGSLIASKFCSSKNYEEGKEFFYSLVSKKGWDIEKAKMTMFLCGANYDCFSGADWRQPAKEVFKNLMFFETPLCEKGLELLIKSGADLNVRDSDDWTALHIASRDNHKELAELLIKNGADLNVRDSDGWTALHIASRYNYKELAELLIKSGADVNVRDSDDLTPLHFVSIYNYKEIAELLIKNEADVNIKDYYNRTALHYARGDNYKELAELLIKNGGTK